MIYFLPWILFVVVVFIFYFMHHRRIKKRMAVDARYRRFILAVRSGKYQTESQKEFEKGFEESLAKFTWVAMKFLTFLRFTKPVSYNHILENVDDYVYRFFGLFLLPIFKVADVVIERFFPSFLNRNAQIESAKEKRLRRKKIASKRKGGK